MEDWLKKKPSNEFTRFQDKMVAGKMVRTKWYGQNGTDKKVYGQNVIGQNGMGKMVQTKWYE